MGLRNITPIAFRPTLLSIPTTPFSPRSPLFASSISHPRKYDPLPPSNSSLQKTRQECPTEKPPPEPLPWVWNCHICTRTYLLGATRRCPFDGHYFCSGTTEAHNWRANGGKTKKFHEPCGSEFDFNAWQVYGDWRRAKKTASDIKDRIDSPMHQYFTHTLAIKPIKRTRTGEAQDCWNNCNYPSECRHGPLKMAVGETQHTELGVSVQRVDPQVLGARSDDRDLNFKDIMETIEDVAVDYGHDSMEDLLAASEAHPRQPIPPQVLESPTSPPLSPVYESEDDGLYDMDLDTSHYPDPSIASIQPMDPLLDPANITSLLTRQNSNTSIASTESTSDSGYSSSSLQTLNGEPSRALITPETFPELLRSSGRFIDARIDLDAVAHTPTDQTSPTALYAGDMLPVRTKRGRRDSPVISWPPHGALDHSSDSTQESYSTSPYWTNEWSASQEDESNMTDRKHAVSPANERDLYFTLDSECFRDATQGAKRGRARREQDGRKSRRVGIEMGGIWRARGTAC